MLQAKLKNGQMIIPSMMPRTRLPLLKKETYYCPVCAEKVVLRAGEKVIPHFAHSPKTLCPTASGGEGVYHEKGKLLLFRWLQKQGLCVELEAYLPEIRQRPDFLIHLKGRRIAIEYQCTRIAENDIIARTFGYKKAGIEVVWILGERLMKRKNAQTLSIDSFSKTVIHQFTPGYPFSLFYFCPLSKNLLKFQDISFTRKNRASGKLTLLPLDKSKFTDLFKEEFLPPTTVKQGWKRDRRNFRLRKRNRLFGEELKWQRWLYLKGTHFEQLPAMIHLPVPGAFTIHVPSWIWQSWIVLDIISPRPLHATISLEQCMKRLGKALLPLERFPLLPPSTNPVLAYLKLLTTLGILVQTSGTSFKKAVPIHFHHQLEQALQDDDRLVEKLFKTLKR